MTSSNGTMRRFSDARGREWRCTVRERQDGDYKGRYHFVLVCGDGEDVEVVELTDVRWNSERSAGRTLKTMSEVELRRRLRQAVGRTPVESD